MATTRKSPSTKKAAPVAKAPAPTTAKPATVSAAKPAAAAKATKPAKVVKPEKPKKPKLVRDSFTIPKPEYVVLDELKQRSAALATPVKKSELLRAGIKALAAMSDAALLAAIKAVPAIKTGRPAAP
jgi:hypothetical protein